MSKFSSKKRYNLNRQLRQLGEQAGALEMLRIARPEQVDELLTALSALTTAAQRPALVRSNSCASMARQGLLHSYVLRAGGEPIAVIIGTRSTEVLHIHNIYVTTKHLALSVGTSAMHLATQDAVGNWGLASIDFGYGTPNSEFRSSHLKQTRATVLLFDRMISISLLLFVHSLFVGAVAALIGAVKWARKKSPWSRKVTLA